MNGHKSLVAMRVANDAPRSVWITDSDDTYSRKTARQWVDEPNIVDGKFDAHIRLEAGDIPGALDFRCVAGLECHIASDRSARRFHQIFEAVKEAGARVAVGVCDGHVEFYEQETKNGI